MMVRGAGAVCFVLRLLCLAPVVSSHWYHDESYFISKLNMTAEYPDRFSAEIKVLDLCLHPSIDTIIYGVSASHTVIEYDLVTSSAMTVFGVTNSPGESSYGVTASA